MSLPRYPEYKDSGVEWLGDVPAHWAITRVQDVANVINGYPFDARLFEAESGYSLIRIRDLDSSETVTRYNGQFVEEAAVTSADILIGMDGDFNVGRWLGDGPALLNQRMCCIRTERGNLATLLRYALPTPLKAINDVTYATTVKHLSSFQVQKLRIALPCDESELSAIATFLERETRKIDALIAEQEKLLTLLAEKRQGTISHAVTKGLNPDVPMKDSGVPWLGEVPRHWKLIRGRFLFSQADEPPKTDDGVVTAFRDGQVTLRENRRTDGFTKAILEVGYQHVRQGDLVIHGMDAFAGAIGVSESDGKCTPEYSVLRGKEPGLSNSYFAATLRVMAKRNFIFVICPSVRERAPRFRYESFKDVVLPVPPTKEQLAIDEHISYEIRKIDDLVSKTTKLVQLLGERRAAIITAAVTGQIDVRGFATQPEAA